MPNVTIFLNPFLCLENSSEIQEDRLNQTLVLKLVKTLLISQNTCRFKTAQLVGRASKSKGHKFVSSAKHAKFCFWLLLTNVTKGILTLR